MINDKNNESFLMIKFFNSLKHNSKILYIYIALTSFIYLLYIFVLSTTLFTSSISIVQNQIKDFQNINPLQGVMSTIGLSTESSGGSYIKDILGSDMLKRIIVQKKWDTNKNLINLWEIKSKGRFDFEEIDEDQKKQIKILKAIKKIDKRIKIIENKTGLIKVDVEMEYPELSSQIANFLFDTLNVINNNIHTQQLKIKKDFILDRMENIKKQLIEAEEKIKDFRESNYDTSSPQLQLDLGRLIREVEIQTTLYTTVKQQYELTNIEQFDNTPDIILIDKAYPSYNNPSKPQKIVTLFIILVVMLASALIHILLLEISLKSKG